MKKLLERLLLKLKEFNEIKNEKEYFNNISMYMISLNKLLKAYSGFKTDKYEKELDYFTLFLDNDFNEKQKQIIKSYLILEKGKEINSVEYNLLFALTESFFKINGRLNGLFFGKEKLLISNKELIKIINNLILKIEKEDKDLVSYINRDFKQILENIKRK